MVSKTKTKTAARSKSAPLEGRAGSKKAAKPSKRPTSPPEDEDAGSAFFHELENSLCKRYELCLVTWNAKTKTPSVDRLGDLDRWDDESAIRKNFGGSGEGRFMVRARGHKNEILAASPTWGERGELRDVNSAATLQTAFETAMGVVTIPGAGAMVNLMFALLQQSNAQTRLDCERHELVIERMFTAVCTRDAAHAGHGGNSETFELILRTLLEDTKSQRAKVTQLLDDNAGLKREGGKSKTSTGDIVQGIVTTVMEQGPGAVDAVRRLFSGELPAEESAALIREKVAQQIAQETARQLAANNAVPSG